MPFALCREILTDLASVVAYERETVALNDVREFRGRERAGAQPVRELVVPDAVVSAQPLARRFHEVCDDVPVREIEHSRLGLRVELSFAVSMGD